MFLNELQEKNKELFLKICLHASLSNKVFADEEKIEDVYAALSVEKLAEGIILRKGKKGFCRVLGE